MDWNKSRRIERYKQPRPKYINFPISFFSSLDGERLDVPQFKAMVGEIIRYGVADWYRRECSAWQNPQEYDYSLFSQTLGKMGISVGDNEKFFYDAVLPSMERVTRSAGHAFCGIPINWLLSFRDDDKELLTPKEVRTLFGVTDKTLHVWGKTGFLPRIRIGGVVRYRRADVERAAQVKGRNI